MPPGGWRENLPREFVGEVDHGLNIFRLGMIEESPVAYDKAAIPTGRIDELLAVIFDQFRSAQLQHGGRHVTEDAKCVTHYLFGIGHIDLIEHPYRLSSVE